MNLRDYTTVSEKKNALEKELGIELPNIGTSYASEDSASKKNCENMIGIAQIPLGVAGPIRIKNQESRSEDYYIPLATTEGALVASVSRGGKAITESGGAVVVTEKKGMTRAPVFAVEGIVEGQKLINYVLEEFAEIKEICESTSSHLTLLEIKPWMVGRNVYLRFRFDTQDAMGMNMVTIATTKASDFIQEQTKARLVAVSGNMCVDKKQNMLNFIEGRGIQVWAEISLSEEIITNILKTSAEKIFETAQRKLVYGSLLSGSIGANAHAANVLAAIFLATGQDVAHIAEASSVVTSVELDEKGVYISVYIPDLPVGVVGGGTGLATQKEALSIIGVKSSEELAKVIGAVVLAGEISLLASLSENSLAKAHERLGRGKK